MGLGLVGCNSKRLRRGRSFSLLRRNTFVAPEPSNADDDGDNVETDSHGGGGGGGGDLSQNSPSRTQSGDDSDGVMIGTSQRLSQGNISSGSRKPLSLPPLMREDKNKTNVNSASATSMNTTPATNSKPAKCLFECRGHTSEIRHACYSPGGTYFVSASADHTARIWDASTGTCTATLEDDGM